MVDIHAMIEGLQAENRTEALAQTAQAALEDLADEYRAEGATEADTTSYLIHLAIQAARNIAP